MDGLDQTRNGNVVSQGADHGNVYTIVFESEQGDLSALAVDAGTHRKRTSAIIECDLNFSKQSPPVPLAPPAGSFRVPVGDNYH